MVTIPIMLDVPCIGILLPIVNERYSLGYHGGHRQFVACFGVTIGGAACLHFCTRASWSAARHHQQLLHWL